MQLNSLYTTHDMRLSNILQQYDLTMVILTLEHLLIVIVDA